MGLFAWSSEYSVKVRAMDEQHQKLFSMIDQLHDAMRAGQGRTVLQPLLRELIRYTEEHFASEERIMAANSFPGLADHRVAHQKLTDQVLAFEKEFKSGNAAISVDLMEFLQNWLTEHINGTDKGYSAHLNSRGVV